MRRIFQVASCAAVLTVALAGCASDPTTDADADVPFTPCSAVECAGTLPGGADFDIILPENWNGTLAIFSHRLDGPGAVPLTDSEVLDSQTPTTPPDGLGSGSEPSGEGRSSKTPTPKSDKKKDGNQSASPSATPVAPPVEPRPGGPELAPLWGQGDRGIADVMLQAGYAIAGATPREQGWVVADQITAAEELHQYFAESIGVPNRVYVWGESAGGLASVRLAELHPDWVSGALAMCAPLSGPLRSYNLALDVGYAIRELLQPDLKLVGYTSEEEARRNRELALRAVQDAAVGDLPEQAKVAFIAGIGQLPIVTRTSAGLTWPDQLRANVASIRNLVDQTTIQRYGLERRVGGNFSGNAGTDYSLRLSSQQKEQLAGIDKGLYDEYLAELTGGTRVLPDPAAEAAAAEQGTPSGQLEVPTITVNNAVDPVYIAPNVSSLRETITATEPDLVGNLVDVFALMPQTVSESQPAGEGIGNCNFETRTILGAMIQLNQWVRNDQYPGRDTVQVAFKGQQVSIDYDPGPWPQMSATPLQAPSATSAPMRAPRKPADGSGDR